MPELDLGQVVGPVGPQGETGPQGEQGIQGPPGADAIINGYNAVSIRAENNIDLEQSGDTLTIKGAYPDFHGSAHGLVPDSAGGTVNYLRADGSWAAPPNTTYSNATASEPGLMSATDKAKLNGVNDYVVDQGTSSSWDYRKWNSGKVELWRYATISAAAGSKTNTLGLPFTMSISGYGYHVQITPIFRGHLVSSVWAGAKDGTDGRTATTVQISMSGTDSPNDVGVMVYIHGQIAS